MAAWEQYLEQHQARFRAEFLDFLRIPSISSLAEHAEDVARAAEWVATRLTAAGMEAVQILPTAGHPVVYAQWLHAPDKPTILIYGHLDVQPVDPIEQWDNPPFEPTIRDERIYARGASDTKGNVLMVIIALEAWLKTTGQLPVNVKCFIEGQEEIGSPQIAGLIEAQRDLLACDLVLNTDSGQWSSEQPALLIGLKGLCAIQIDVQGARSDLHSGQYGGAVANPIHALTQVLASMRSPEGAILVEGFYDQVLPLSERDRAQIAAVPFDEAAYQRELDVDALVGEPGYSVQEQLWARPTLEVNGIWGGFQGEGVKTVLPNAAHAKITCRLVHNQDAAAIQALLEAHIKRQMAPGVRVTVDLLPGNAAPYLVPPDHWGNQAAATVLAAEYGCDPYYVRVGGSIPILDMFLQMLGAYAVNVGFGLNDEQVHAPNEFLRLSSFDRGQRVFIRLLQQLALSQ